jgi:hypothetical protein
MPPLYLRKGSFFVQKMGSTTVQDHQNLPEFEEPLVYGQKEAMNTLPIFVR